MPRKINRRKKQLVAPKESKNENSTSSDDESSDSDALKKIFPKRKPSPMKWAKHYSVQPKPSNHGEIQSQSKLIFPSAGTHYCKKPYFSKTIPTPFIRTIYSKFPKEDINFVWHFLTTILLYFLLYPFVNFVWTYFFLEAPDVVAMFYKITDNSLNEGGLLGHFRKLDWLQLPPVTAETVSLVIAFTVKEFILSHWQGANDFISLCSTLSDQLTLKCAQGW